MKNAPVQPTNESAPDKRDYNPGRLPKLVDTVRSSVLAALLEGHALTGMDAVFNEATTRLSAAVCALQQTHGWTIERHDIDVATSDGRITPVTSYWLRQSTIRQAHDAGAAKWIASVKAARAGRRKLAPQCKKKAAQSNARKFDPRQADMWGAQ